MNMRNAHVFVDGANLWEASSGLGASLANPFQLAKGVIFRAGELVYGNAMEKDHVYELSQVVYYEARPSI